MTQTGNLTVEFSDARRQSVDEDVNFVLRHALSKACHHLPALSTRKPLTIAGLETADRGVYRLSIFPCKHRPVTQLLQLVDGPNLLRVILTVDPAKVASVRFPRYELLHSTLRTVLEASAAVETHPGSKGHKLYSALDHVARAGLLNVCCKMASTRFADQRSVFDYVQSFRRFDGNRVFADVSEDLHRQTVNSIATRLFHAIPVALHLPPDGMELVGSYKTYDPFGNLHLTFFRQPATAGLVAEIDVDGAQGIQHLAHLVGSSAGRGAHPYDIHQILLRYQDLDPGYQLEV